MYVGGIVTATRKIVVIAEPRVIEIREEEIADPGDGEVMIQATRSLISTGTEMTAYTGDFPRDKSAWANYVKYPFKTGYSHVGQVVKVGPGVDGLAIGDRVFSHAHHTSLVVQKETAVNKLPAGVPDDQAALASISSIAMNGVRMAEIALGEVVVVVGLGIVGQMAIRYARLNGAYPLIAMDVSDERLSTARAAGATNTLNPRHQDPLGIINSITRGRKADVVFEVTGNPSVIPTLPPLLHRSGRLILLGSPRGKTTIDFHDEVHTFGQRIIGAHASNHPLVETPFNQWTHARNIELYLDLLGAGLVQTADLITHRFPWREAAAVYRSLMEDRTRTLGVILNWED
jgi:2-desacetyl-2-hydroxyethyl bacteriochlorophyllide A dehydrogenase